MRLNRFLARCGLGSRRSVEALVAAGRVSVNDVAADRLGIEIDPGADRVCVDGAPVALPPPVHLLLNKPAGCDVTRRDPHSKRTVFDLLGDAAPESIQPVGRLDRETTGLLILSNDGELNFRLTHPRFAVEKEYLAVGPKPARPGQIRALLRGVELEDGFARAIGAEALDRPPTGDGLPGGVEGSALRLSLHEGRKRIVRRMCAAVGFELTHLHRTRIGPLRLGAVETGRWRDLSKDEIAQLNASVDLDRGDDR